MVEFDKKILFGSFVKNITREQCGRGCNFGNKNKGRIK
jgi:hypothetical protein